MSANIVLLVLPCGGSGCITFTTTPTATATNTTTTTITTIDQCLYNCDCYSG